MKRGFARPTPEKPPVIKPENIVLSTPLSIPPPEGKPWWLIVVGVVVVGLLGGMVAMVFASGSHVFGGIGSIFPLFMMVGIMMMMFRGMGGGQQQMSRPKLDAMRAQFMLMLDMLRETPKSRPTAWTPTIGGSTRRPIRWRPPWGHPGCGSASPTVRT